MSTNVFWAGNVSGEYVVSIFNNPEDKEGDNAPLTDLENNIDRVYFDSRFKYLNIIINKNITVNYPEIQAGDYKKETALNTIYMHNHEYPLSAVLVDDETGEIVTTAKIQNNRTATFLIDDNRYYLKYDWEVTDTVLPEVTKTYTLLAFETSLPYSSGFMHISKDLVTVSNVFNSSKEYFYRDTDGINFDGVYMKVQ